MQQAKVINKNRVYVLMLGYMEKQLTAYTYVQSRNRRMSDKRNDLARSITGKRTEAHFTFILDPVTIAGGAACPRTTAIFPQVRKMREKSQKRHSRHCRHSSSFNHFYRRAGPWRLVMFRKYWYIPHRYSGHEEAGKGVAVCNP